MSILTFLLTRHSIVNPFALVWHRFRNLLGSKTFLLVLDIDGTIWPNTGPGSFFRPFKIYRIWETQFTYNPFENCLVFVTNQSSFARLNHIKYRSIFYFYLRVFYLMMLTGATAVYFCNHHPDATYKGLRTSCQFRKPSSKMIQRAIKSLDQDPRKAILVGDRITDVIAGASAGLLNTVLIYNDEMFLENINGDIGNSEFAFFEVAKLKDIKSYFSHRLHYG